MTEIEVVDGRAAAKRDRPLISIIVAVLNGVSTLSHCIDSVAGQTLRDVELVIKDGASTDGTLEVLRKRASNIAHWETGPDAGIFAAWNNAIRAARGEWLLFLGADDYLHSDDALERASAHIAVSSPSVQVLYGRLEIVTHDGVVIDILGRPWPESRRQHMQMMALPHAAVLYRRNVFERFGLFDETYRIAGDYEFLLRALRASEARYMPDVLVASMQVGGLSLNPTQSWKALSETYRARRKHVSRWPAPLWLFAVAKVAVRITLWRILGEQHARRCLDFLRRLAGLPPYWTVAK